MDQWLQIIGINHKLESPDHLLLTNYLKTNISIEDKVAIESPQSLEWILTEGNSSNYSDYKFLYSVCTTLKLLGAEVKPIEDQRAYQLQVRRWQWFLFEHERLNDDWIWQKLMIRRSISLFHLAQQENSDYLITGVIHAYHLQQMGCPSVNLISKLSNKTRENEDRWIKKYGMDLRLHSIF